MESIAHAFVLGLVLTTTTGIASAATAPSPQTTGIAFVDWVLSALLDSDAEDCPDRVFSRDPIIRNDPR